MDLVFAAEQYVQAQAAAAAAAQYYANAANVAMGAAAAANSQQPQNVVVTSPAAPALGLVPQPIISGTQVLGPQFLPRPPSATAGGSLPPPPLPPVVSSGELASSERGGDSGSGRRRDKRDDRDRDRDRERDRDRDRDRRDRDRDRDRNRDRDRDSGRRYDRGGDREHRWRDRSSPPPHRRSDRSRSPRRDRTPESDEEARNIAPNNTIMVRGLAQHIMESDIYDDISACRLVARDIRLIRKKETGASRGFAFVEFAKIQDAEKWMEEKQGILMFKDQYRAVMQYSIPRDGKPGEPPRLLHDWICAKCGVQNFRRRDQCFKCGGPRTDDGSDAAAASDEVSPHPTNTVLLGGLDVLSTEDSVLDCLVRLTQLPIKSIRIGKDSLTNTSRGVCYVEMNTVVDAMFLHNQLLGEPPQIDEKLVSVCYHRSSHNQTSGSSGGQAKAALAAAQWSHQRKYTEEEVESLAEYSASTYANNPTEKAKYLQYYRQFYRNGGKVDDGSRPAAAAPEPDPKPRVDLGVVTVNGVEYKRYPEPDVTTYSYDQTSGYYYDAATTLYYDSKSQYYLDSKSGTYVYWSSEHETYLPAKDGTGGEEKKEGGKKDKVKTAKKIAKDMAKWAKSMNQRKDAAAKEKQPPASSTTTTAAISSARAGGGSSTVGSEDIAFSMLQKRDNPTLGPSSSLFASSTSAFNCPPPTDDGLGDASSSLDASSSKSSSGGGGVTGLGGLASYGSDSEEEGSLAAAACHTDWTKLACLLCKRQFPSKEKLTKHNQVSDLHKENYENWKRSRPGSSDQPPSQQYRDRAKERRAKYGEVDEDAKSASKLKEKYVGQIEKSIAASLPEKNIGQDNIGNQMLQKMGWKEGLGLGKSNQGRTSIIEAERRNGQAGLGNGAPVRTNPNDSYKDCVKKTLFQRFREVD